MIKQTISSYFTKRWLEKYSPVVEVQVVSEDSRKTKTANNASKETEESKIRQVVSNYFNKRWLKKHFPKINAPKFKEFEKVAEHQFYESMFVGGRHNKEIMPALTSYILNTDLYQDKHRSINLFVGNPINFKTKFKGDFSVDELINLYDLLLGTKRIVAYSQSKYGDDMFTGTINPEVYKLSHIKQFQIKVPKIKMAEGNFVSGKSKKLIQCINTVLSEHSHSFSTSRSEAYSRRSHVSFETAISAYNAINGNYQGLTF